MTQYHFPEHMKKPWEILLWIGYTPGKGLGRQEQRMKDALETPEERNGPVLGYPGYSSKDLEKLLTWSLSNHFISVRLQFKDKSVLEEVSDLLEDPKNAALTSSPYSKEVPDITLSNSPEIPLPLDISANNSSEASSKDTNADSLALCDLTNLFSNLRPCPSEQEGVGAID